MKLKDIVDIQIGYQHSRKIVPVLDGTNHIIQIKDINENHTINFEGFLKIQPDRSVERYLVHKGNVLFLCRGQRNFAIPVLLELKDTIAAGHFFILAFDNSKILPKYLAWYINQTPAQRYLQHMAKRGTHMPIIGKSEFEQMTIHVPTLKTQKNIIALNELQKKEHRLVQEILQKRSRLIQAVCLNTAEPID